MVEDTFYLLKKCPICNNSNYHPIYAQCNQKILHPLYMKCCKCKTIFANPIASKDTLNRYYTSQYYESGKIPPPTSIELSKFKHKVEYKVIKSLLKKGSVLEIGSGFGGVLYNLQKDGYDVCGVEPSIEAAQFCKSLGVNTVINKNFEETDFGSMRFSLILAWHVIEHVLNVNLFLQKLHSLLDQDGYAIIGTENYATARDAIKRIASFSKTNIPESPTSTEHTYYFSVNTLKSIINKNDFKVIKTNCYAEPSKKIFKKIISKLETLAKNGNRQYQIIQKI